MATSKNTPNAAEASTDVPQEPAPEQVHVQAGDSVDQSEQAVSDFERQNPKPAQEPAEEQQAQEEDEEVDPQEKLDKEMQEDASDGDVWARYITSQNHMRGITVKDQVDLGVPKDGTYDNSKDAKPRTLQGELEPGLWFTLQNRWRARINDVHPILREYFDEDPDFVVKEY